MLPNSEIRSSPSLSPEKNHKFGIVGTDVNSDDAKKHATPGLENIGPYRTPELAQLGSDGKEQREVISTKAIQDAKKDGSLNLPMQAWKAPCRMCLASSINDVVQAVGWVSRDPERARLVGGFSGASKTSIETLDSREMATKTHDATDLRHLSKNEKKQKQTIVK